MKKRSDQNGGMEASGFLAADQDSAGKERGHGKKTSRLNQTLSCT